MFFFENMFKEILTNKPSFFNFLLTNIRGFFRRPWCVTNHFEFSGFFHNGLHKKILDWNPTKKVYFFQTNFSRIYCQESNKKSWMFYQHFLKDLLTKIMYFFRKLFSMIFYDIFTGLSWNKLCGLDFLCLLITSNNSGF